MDRGLEAVTVCAMKHEAFILRTKAGQWMFQVHRDGGDRRRGRFADQFRGHRGSTRSLRHVEALALVVQADPDEQTRGHLMAKTTTKAKKATPTPTPPATTPDKRHLSRTSWCCRRRFRAQSAFKPGKFAGEVDLAELLKDLRERVEKVQAATCGRSRPCCTGRP